MNRRRFWLGVFWLLYIIFTAWCFVQVLKYSQP